MYKQRLHQRVHQRIAKRVRTLRVDIRGIVDQRKSADRLPIAVERHCVDVHGYIVDGYEFAQASVAQGRVGGGRWARLKSRGQSWCEGQGSATGVVNGNSLEVLALPETVHDALQALVRQGAIKKR